MKSCRTVKESDSVSDSKDSDYSRLNAMWCCKQICDGMEEQQVILQNIVFQMQNFLCII